MTGSPPSPGTRRPPIPAPEIIAGVIGVVVVVIVLSAGMAGGRSTPSGAVETSRPSGGAATPSVATPEPVVDPQVVALLGEVNLRLADAAAALRDEVDRSSLRPRNIRELIGRVSTNAAIGADQVNNLGGAMGDEEPGGRLAALYGRISTEAERTQDNALANEVAYQAGGLALIELIGQLPLLQDALETLLLASPSPSPSVASPSPSAPPSSPPAASPSPSPPSAPPGSPSPSGEVPSGSPTPFRPGGPEPTRAPDEQIENGGFEDRDDTSWALLKGPGVNGVLTLDVNQPATGGLSARVDVTTGSDAYAGIALRQSGLQLEIGRNYTVTFNVRSAAERPFRVKIQPAFGGSYAPREFVATPAWTPIMFSFYATDTDPTAVLEIQLGRSTATIWIDTVSFRPTPAF